MNGQDRYHNCRCHSYSTRRAADRLGHFRLAGLIFPLLSVLLPALAVGQAVPPASPPTAEPGKPAPPTDPFGRDTPYGTTAGFLDATTKGDYKRAARYLDSNRPASEEEDLARKLSYVIDHALSVDTNTVSRDPEGELDDNGKPVRRVVLGIAKAGEDSLEIDIDRVQGRTKPPLWLFSAGTLTGIPPFAERLKPNWLEANVNRLLPQWTATTKLLSIPILRWINSLLMLLVFVLGTYLMSQIAIWITHWVLKFQTKWLGSVAALRLERPFRLIAAIIMMSILSDVAASFVGRRIFGQLRYALIVAGVVWIVVRLVDAVSHRATMRSAQTARTGRLALIHLTRGIVKAALFLTGVVVVLSSAGVNLSTLVAGLGIGGVAVAFAAQKTIENLFGTAALVMDQSASVGDFCRIGDFMGTIQSIGLRATRIRTPDDTLVTIPNGQISSAALTNISARGKILFTHTVPLSRGTNSSQLQAVLDGFEELLRRSVDVESSTSRVRLLRIGSSSLDVELWAYILTRDYGQFLAIQQRLLVSLLQIVETSGTSIALPSQTLYLADQRPDREPESRSASASQR